MDDNQALPPDRPGDGPGLALGEHQAAVTACLDRLRQDRVVDRIWDGDHTVWKPDPTEITNRLGWLRMGQVMRGQVPALEAFAREIQEAGFNRVVLLGMGGSSLGPEVLGRTFGDAPRRPKLIVLDSTVPAWVEATARAAEPSRTLFLVSSKSGSTTEPNMFYSYFRGLVDREVGPDRAGQHFAAVTDPGTPLEALAQAQGFRRVFSNPPDVGGRYSVLSCFGLVPAALIGVDLGRLLDRADAMARSCAAGVPIRDNPAAQLGAAMSALSGRGLDKLTVVTSPFLDSFGLWVEQLVAESTGKEGKGIIPIAGEPVMAPEHYGADRLFVYLRLNDDDNAERDAAIEALAGAGHPALRLDLADRYDLGAEFFRWEMATAVAGAALGINPFDQPNVQAAKDMTENVLEEYRAAGRLLSVDAPESLESPELLEELLAQSRPGGYLAIMAYLHRTPEIDEALDTLRRNVMRSRRIATSVGYGPRFLHSTGQLHKGGPDSGLFLQLTAEHARDLDIPGQEFTFGVLADAQALGDLQALKHGPRGTARIHLGADPAAAIQRLALNIL